MGDSTRKDVVPISPKAELERVAERITSRMLATADAVAELGPLDLEDAKDLTPKQKKIWRDSQKPDVELPAYMKYALRFNEAVNRKDADRSGARVNVNVQHATISLPAPMPPPIDVKYVDADELKGEDGDE